MLIVFLTSFGRCWAEQYGLLNGSSWACCPTEAIVTFSPIRQNVEESHDHSHEHHEHGSHDCGSQEVPQERQDRPVPLPLPSDETPCGVCCLIDSGFAQVSSSVEIPAPIFDVAELLWFLERIEYQLKITAKAVVEPPPRSAIDQNYSISTSELVTSTTVSVRGPNVK